LFQPAPDGHATHGRFDDRALSNTPAFNPKVVRGVLATSTAVLFFALGGIATYFFLSGE
jgi:hypothetical protein